MRQHTFTWLLVLFGFCLPAASVSAVEADTVFKTVCPSVVLIKDLESFGSGVVLTPDGLIVTCYHVVNTPLALTVVAEVQKMGQRTKQEFQDVKIVGVHPSYDLALIQVKAPAGVSFIVPPKSSGRPLNTGEDCFVIGNPSGAAGKVLENSISKGIVGAANRVIEDQNYIQVTAQINPGNSGGALCDKNGQLVGIVTFKIGEAEGLGFAIPIVKTRKTDFVPESERKGNTEEALKYEEAGAKWFNLARRSSGNQRDAALYLAYVCYRLSLAELPNNPSPYNNVGLMYYEMEEYEISRAFYQKAVALSPDYPTSHQMLGMIAIKQNDSARAEKHFLAGIQTKLTSPVDLSAQANCIQSYGIELIKKHQYAEAAYLAKWSLSVRTDRDQQAALQKMLQVCGEKLTDAQFTEISGKQDDFSLGDMKRFAQGKRTTGTATQPTPYAASTTALPPAASASTPAKIFEKMLAEAPKPGPTGLRKAIPEAPADIRPAFGGAYLVFHFPTIGKLGVFNVAQAKFDTYLPVSDNAIYAAGGSTLLVYLPQDRVFQLYDMNTLQRRGSKPSRIIGELTDIEMSLFNSQLALISYADSTEALSRRHYAILNLDTFQSIEIVDPQNHFAHNRCFRDNIHMRLDDNFTAVASWATSHSPSGFIFAHLSPQGIRSSAYEHSDFGSLSPDRTGQRVYSTRGFILGPKAETLKTFAKSALFPVRGSDYFLEISKKVVTVREPLGGSEINRFELPFEYANTAWNKNHLTDDRVVHACAQLNRACFVDLKALSLYEFELGLGSNLQQIRQALEGVRRGTLWTRKMDFPAGTKVTIEDAPPGVKYDPTTTVLSWQIPPTQPAGNVTLLLSVTMPGKDEAYQRLVVPLQ